MPIYEYRCNACGYVFEKLRSMSNADSPTGCPECGAEDSRRLVSTFAAVSKGDGGTTTPISGGSSCGSCSSSSCTACSR